METLYKWRVQEKDRLGRVRWRIVKSPMSEDTARFWAANNNRIIERVDLPVTGQQGSPVMTEAAGWLTATRRN